ncbi:MAG: recombinase family protein [Acidobacteria bacterium]|nr:recombinase family protein [Acidobacteriota bacterium]
MSNDDRQKNGRTVIRCAIYTRKSTEEGLEQAFNTLDAQRDAGEAYIQSQKHEGWVALPERYDDGGYTGANMDRPALKRLLEAIELGVVNCVIVYKVDRLTRALLDFSRIIEVFDKHGVSFVSVTQQFNTTNSLGRLTLNILLSFAQFEREMIAERTRDKMGAARRRGKWVGGNPVLGYDVSPKGGSLVINESEAQRVREIFNMYLEFGSLIPVIEELNRRGWRMKAWVTREGRNAGGKIFVKNSLYNMLTNIIYTGKVGFDGQVYEGEHARIVDDGVWNRVQEGLNRNGRRGGRNISNKHGAILKGLVRCASCDAGMTHTYTKKRNRLYRYYVCVTAHQRGWSACETRSVSAPELEHAVVEQIRGIAGDPAIFAEVVRQLGEQRRETAVNLGEERAALDRDLRRVAREMSSLTTEAAQAGAPASAERLADLHERLASLEGRLGRIRLQLAETASSSVDATDLRDALAKFDPLWEHMNSHEQAQLVHALVEQVRYDGRTGTVTLGFRSAGIKQMCGLDSINRETSSASIELR